MSDDKSVAAPDSSSKEPTVVESHGEPVIIHSTSASGQIMVEPEDSSAPKHAADTTAEPILIEHPVAASPAVPAPAPPESVPAATVAAIPIAATPVADSTTQPVAPPTAPRTVYVDAPTAPKSKSNRGVGSLIALLSAILYGVLFALVAALIIYLTGGNVGFGRSVTTFFSSAAFWTPVVVFAVAMILLVLLLNRSGWGAYIVGGFFVAVAVYFAYIGGALLTVRAWEYTPAQAGQFISQVSLTPLALAAAIVAREIAIWVGAAIAARGRRVKTRNVEARAAFERDTQEKKAEYERVSAGYAGTGASA